MGLQFVEKKMFSLQIMTRLMRVRFHLHKKGIQVQAVIDIREKSQNLHYS